MSDESTETQESGSEPAASPSVSSDSSSSASGPVGAVPGSGGSDRGRDLGFLRDVPLEISVEIGRTRMPIAEILELGPGAVLELGRAATEPLDVLVNGVLFAKGEAVLVNDRYGVRIRQLVDEDQVLESLDGGEPS